jgi:hypothetical protein
MSQLRDLDQRFVTSSIRSIVVRNLNSPPRPGLVCCRVYPAAPISLAASSPPEGQGASSLWEPPPPQDLRLPLLSLAPSTETVDPVWFVGVDSLPASFALSLFTSSSSSSSDSDLPIFDMAIRASDLVVVGAYRDLEKAKKLPINAVFFVAEPSGRLLAPRAVAAQLAGQTWVKPSALEMWSEGETGFARLVGLVGNQRMAQLMDAAARARAAREAMELLPAESVLRDVASGAQRAVQASVAFERHLELVEKKGALALAVDQLRAHCEQLQARVDERIARMRSESEAGVRALAAQAQKRAQDIESAKQALRRSELLLRARRLVLASSVMRINPLAQAQASQEIRDDERGRLAHVAGLLGYVFDVPMRFVPLAFSNKSVIVDPCLVSVDVRRFRDFLELSAGVGLGCFPLYAAGLERAAKRRFDVGLDHLDLILRQLVRGIEWRFRLVAREFDAGAEVFPQQRQQQQLLLLQQQQQPRGDGLQDLYRVLNALHVR